MQPKYLGYLKSIGEELRAKSNQVRDLIGDKHWLTDGRHKESILIAVIERYLPYGYSVGTGFVVDCKDPNHISREQDIVIFDNRTEPPLFKSDRLIISSGEALIAVISVKTKFGKKEIRDSVETLLTAREVCSSVGKGNELWCGMFSYEKAGNQKKLSKVISEEIARALFQGKTRRGQEEKCGPDAFCEASEKLIIADYGEHIKRESGEFGRLREFNLRGTSPATFLALLIAAISQRNRERVALMTDLLRSDKPEKNEPISTPIKRRDVPIPRKTPHKRKQ